MKKRKDTAIGLISELAETDWMTMRWFEWFFPWIYVIWIPFSIWHWKETMGLATRARRFLKNQKKGGE